MGGFKKGRIAGTAVVSACVKVLNSLKFRLSPKNLELYRGVTGSFFGIGILPVSDLLDFRYFGRYY